MIAPLIETPANPHDVISSASETAAEKAMPRSREGDIHETFPKRICELGTEKRDGRLPILATANDVRELIQFLKKRPAGVSISEIPQPLKKRIFYPTKVAAYELWGIATKQGERLKLTPLGWEFAQCLEPEARIYRTLLANTAIYSGTLAWIHSNQADVVTQDEVAHFWLKEYDGAVKNGDQKEVHAGIVCFFHLCQAAEFGTMTIGKRGQPARLRILLNELETHVRTSTLSETLESCDDPWPPRTVDGLPTFSATIVDSEPTFRIYVSHRNSSPIIDRVRKILDLNDMRCELVEDGEDRDPISEEALSAMRQCSAAILVIHSENFSQRNLLEIALARVLYDRRVVVLLHTQVGPVNGIPYDLQHLRFGDQLSLESGLELMAVLRSFRKAFSD